MTADICEKLTTTKGKHSGFYGAACLPFVVGYIARPAGLSDIPQLSDNLQAKTPPAPEIRRRRCFTLIRIAY